VHKDIVIHVEGLSKVYRLGITGTGALYQDLNKWWARLTRQEDPYEVLHHANGGIRHKSSGEFKALDNVSFEIKQGEVLGIIGKNGAGKSTLLKILSRVTTPSQGKIMVRGRLASLLEVGTGFHPELTGRENIFLNGAILGMTRHEIRSKFDEIVDFSGIEKFIDTPVKRYSSGMYVRLAFAIAAHLDPEILIIDEVLAVGDAEFQKKCLGKMHDVSSREGRTILFVSHNMSAVTSLCTSCVYLKGGKIHMTGKPETVVGEYMNTENISLKSVQYHENSRPGDEIAKLHSARLIDEHHNDLEVAYIHRKIGIEFHYEVLKSGYRPVPNIHIHTGKGEYAFIGCESSDNKFFETGPHKSIMWIPENILNEGKYIIGVALSTMNPLHVHFYEPEALVLDTIEDKTLRNMDYNQDIPGVLRPMVQWETIKLKF
jgi:lipopolysaccharide transport system ATP-binding protein